MSNWKWNTEIFWGLMSSKNCNIKLKDHSTLPLEYVKKNDVMRFKTKKAAEKYINGANAWALMPIKMRYDNAPIFRLSLATNHKNYEA